MFSQRWHSDYLRQLFFQPAVKDELPFGYLNFSMLLKQQIEKQTSKFKAKAESSVSTFSFMTFVTLRYNLTVVFT